MPGLDNSESVRSAVDKLEVSMKEMAQEPLKGEVKVWNTKNLGLRLASDFVSGGTAATMVAPLITIIDKFVLSLHPFFLAIP